MSYQSIYYFLIANQATQKEIGTFVDNSATGNSINDFNIIVEKSKEILHSSELNQNKNRRNRLMLQNYNIYYIVTNANILYLAAVKKNSIYCEQESLIFELIEDIDHQGIKKLVDKNGELTNVGRQNLKFSIEKYQENKKTKMVSPNSSIYDTTGASSERQEPVSKIERLNSEIGEIKKEMKVNVQNMISNVNEMQDLDSKSSRIKDVSLEFKKNSIELEQKAKWNKYKMKIIIGVTILVVLGFVIYLITR